MKRSRSIPTAPKRYGSGALLGGLWGLQGKPIPEAWTAPWQGRVAVTLAGVGELELEDLVERTTAVTMRIAE